DIGLPRLGGVEATSQIRRFDPTTPIISMTSSTSAQDCVTYYSNGMNDILAKPFTRTRLFDVLDKYCMHLKVMPNFQDVHRIFEQPPPRIDGGSNLNENWPVTVFSIPNEGEEYNQAVSYPMGEEYMPMFNIVSLSNAPTTGTVRYIDDVYGDDEASNNRQRKRPKFELLE
ncbi:6690_t:CDS:2, partial [Paraglomus occultum]